MEWQGLRIPTSGASNFTERALRHPLAALLTTAEWSISLILSPTFWP